MIDEILIDDFTEDEWLDSAENAPADEEWPEERGDEQCLTIFDQVEQALLVKPTGKCVKETAPNGVVWNV